MSLTPDEKRELGDLLYRFLVEGDARAVNNWYFDIESADDVVIDLQAAASPRLVELWNRADITDPVDS